jgi:hypothetical protein
MSLVKIPDHIDPKLSSKLRKASPEELAVWQRGWKEHTAEWILAEKEWQRRFIVEAAFWQRMSAWIGVIGAIIGALIAVLAPLALRNIAG